jgi:hypothetical protein
MYRHRHCPSQAPPPLPSLQLEILHLPLVLLGRLARIERAEVPPLAGLFVLLARLEAVFSFFQDVELPMSDVVN